MLAEESDEDDEDLTVMMAGDGHVYGAAGACETEAAVWDDLLPSLQNFDCCSALRTECQFAAWPLARQSFWLPADATPDGPLEELASRILKFHTADAPARFDLRRISGAEWWANISRSESIERDGTGDINLHFDKDERAFEQFGVVVHPLLSTVTYLSDSGASTVVLPRLSLARTDAQRYEFVDGASPKALVVPPRIGRHLRFDGRWLHGAPAGFSVVRGSARSGGGGGGNGSGGGGGSHDADGQYERVTFCVNIWVNHRPGRCPRFADRPGVLSAVTPSPLGAPRLRLTSARGIAATREARHAEGRQARLSCSREANARRDDAEETAHVALRLEQTNQPHICKLPRPPKLAGLLEQGRVVRLEMDGGVLSQCESDND
jgi:hypothetical protein